MIRRHTNKATGIAARLYRLNIISSRTVKNRLVCCCIRRAVCAVPGMSADIALHDGRASVSAVHTSDEATGGTSALHIHGGGNVFDIELSTAYEADETAGVLSGRDFHARIFGFIISILMIIREDAIYRQIRTRFSEEHAGICCIGCISNLIIS